MTSEPSDAETQPVLPLWRLISGIAVFAAMIIVLASLAPVYMEDLRLRQYLQEMVRGAAQPDDMVRSQVLVRARQLDLPVLPDEIEITHPDGKLRLEIKYAVQMHLTLYQVDLHFHPSAQN